MQRPSERAAIAAAGPTRLGAMLRDSRMAQAGELVLVFAAAVGVLLMLRPLAGEGPIGGALPASAAILLQIGLVWAGLRVRGERWERFGLRLARPTGRAAIGLAWRAVVALVLGLAGFVIGAIVGANLFGMPDAPDLSAYNPLAGNLPLLLVTLAGVYVTASFGEEVIYRAFLINRVETLVRGPARAHDSEPRETTGATRGGRRTAVSVALIVSAVMFGLAHWTWGGIGMVQTGFMGLGLGAAYLMFGRNLWVTILAHGCMDTTLLVQMYLAG